MVFLIPDVGTMLVKKQKVRGRSNFFSGSNQRGDPVCHSRTPRDAAPQRDYVARQEVPRWNLAWETPQPLGISGYRTPNI